MCYDKTGEVIHMPTNAAVPWRRFSSGRDLEFYSVVAQGSGTFRGIVVADDVAPVRFGDLGRYQLRAMTQGEIALTEEPFSKTIVEWNWNDRQNDLTPEIGEGEIDKYDATQAGSPDFNNVVCSGNGGGTSEQKGLVPNGSVVLSRQWWDFDKDEGKYFDISFFSTQSITGIEPDFRHRLGTRKHEQHLVDRPCALESALLRRRRHDVPARYHDVPDRQEAFDRSGGAGHRRTRRRATPSICAGCRPIASARRRWCCACK